MLVDVRPLHVTGKDAEDALQAVNITVNKNGIPFDPEPPVRTSGVRLGTPAVTTRGFGTSEMREVAGLIADAIEKRDDLAAVQQTKERAIALATAFPLPGALISQDLEPHARVTR
jgi:glycine hydroxymethyltransferase